MNNKKTEIEAVLQRVDDTIRTAKFGLSDFLNENGHRRMSGLRNLIVFGRSVTFVLQNLRSVIQDEFDKWYEPQQLALKADPLMRYFVEARNELEKQGRLSVAANVHIKSFSNKDMANFGTPPKGAKAFFIGDQLGGTGWEVELADGTLEKYYVELPNSIGDVKLQFSNLPEAITPELKGATVEELCQRYINRLDALINDARAHFLNVPKASPPVTSRPRHLKLVK